MQIACVKIPSHHNRRKGIFYLITRESFNMVKRQPRPQINSASLNLVGTAEMSGTLKQGTIDAMVT